MAGLNSDDSVSRKGLEALHGAIEELWSQRWVVLGGAAGFALLWWVAVSF